MIESDSRVKGRPWYVHSTGGGKKEKKKEKEGSRDKLTTIIARKKTAFVLEATVMITYLPFREAG